MDDLIKEWHEHYSSIAGTLTLPPLRLLARITLLTTWVFHLAVGESVYSGQGKKANSFITNLIHGRYRFNGVQRKFLIWLSENRDTLLSEGKEKEAETSETDDSETGWRSDDSDDLPL